MKALLFKRPTLVVKDWTNEPKKGNQKLLVHLVPPYSPSFIQLVLRVIVANFLAQLRRQLVDTLKQIHLYVNADI